MSDVRESFGLLGVVVAMAACCGLPLLLAGGIAIGAAGLALGSGLVVAAGITLATWGWRRRQKVDHCDAAAGQPPVDITHHSRP